MGKVRKEGKPAKDELKAEGKDLSGVAEAGKTLKKAKTKQAKKPAAGKAEKEAVQAVQAESPKTLTPKDLAKIAKKKAKKDAQKLKKQQRKEQPKEDQKPPKPQDESEIEESKKETKKATKKAAKKATANNKSEGKRASPEVVPEVTNAFTGPGKWERKPDDEAATVFVGNLPVNTKRVQLVKLFQPYAPVRGIRMRTAGGKMLFKHKQRKAAGTLNAYVVLSSPEVAARSLALNGQEFKEHHLRVTPSVLAPPSGDSEAPTQADAKRTVFLGNLKYSANEEKLREIFSSCGEIEYIRCLQGGEKGCKGVAYVCFQQPDAVGLALELHGTLLDDRPINVERYAAKKLGAKKTRDAAAAASASGGSAKDKAKKQNSAGAKKRLDKKGPKDAKASEGPKKKSEFRGVKVDASKKAKKPKKKTNDRLQALAKKIAPKPKS
ncbi:hypothetical protein KR018_006889 [Drosophila ironensis]|nr:hypothetical protein KR018_006889 [Drosophila ironensis]